MKASTEHGFILIWMLIAGFLLVGASAVPAFETATAVVPEAVCTGEVYWENANWHLKCIGSCTGGDPECTPQTTTEDPQWGDYKWCPACDTGEEEGCCHVIVDENGNKVKTGACYITGVCPSNPCTWIDQGAPDCHNHNNHTAACAPAPICN